METRRDVFHAISDPTRREIINMIAYKSLNLNSIAEHFDVSRQAISVHIKVLTECGLVVITQQGRERYCEAKLRTGVWLFGFSLNKKLIILGISAFFKKFYI